MERKKKIAPSILAADFTCLGEQLGILEMADADYLHIDVMDGCFVPSISFGMPLISSIRKKSELFFDVHLMVSEPSRYIREFADCGANLLTVHAEACTHLHRTLCEIRDKGMKAGVALNPATPLSVLDYVLEETDLVLVMSVNPGFGGQSFIPGTYGKLTKLREILDKKGLSTEIEVDGGVTLENVGRILDAGADVIVSGSSVFKGDISGNVRKFHELMR